MKNLMNLKNAKILSKVEQKSINGGAGQSVCTTDDDCPGSSNMCYNGSGLVNGGYCGPKGGIY